MLRAALLVQSSAVVGINPERGLPHLCRPLRLSAARNEVLALTPEDV